VDRHLPTDADCEILRANPVSFANRTKQKNTETFLQEPLIKLRFSRVILSLKALHSLRMVKLQDLLTADTTNGRKGPSVLQLRSSLCWFPGVQKCYQDSVFLPGGVPMSLAFLVRLPRKIPLPKAPINDKRNVLFLEFGNGKVGPAKQNVA
jgi:hypothetical protein